MLNTQTYITLHTRVQGPLRESPLQPGARGLPYYCTPLVCVPKIQGGLAVWRLNQPKPKGRGSWRGAPCRKGFQYPGPAWDSSSACSRSTKLAWDRPEGGYHRPFLEWVLCAPMLAR